GAAWCAKGSALLALPVFALHAISARGRKGLGEAALVVLGFSAAASPLLVANAQAFGSPLYDVNTAHVAWEDGWDQDLDRTSTATMSSWLEGHSLADGVSRL